RESCLLPSQVRSLFRDSLFYDGYDDRGNVRGVLRILWCVSLRWIILECVRYLAEDLSPEVLVDGPHLQISPETSFLSRGAEDVICLNYRLDYILSCLRISPWLVAEWRVTDLKMDW